MKIVIGEPKTRKSYQIEKDVPALTGLKIGDNFDGSLVGLTGFNLQITGGSDKDGFPMRVEIPGPGRRKVLLSGPPGFWPLKEGQRKRKHVRGNTLSADTMQLNCKIVSGEGDVATILGIQPKEKKEEKKTEAQPAESKEEKPAESKPTARTPSAEPTSVQVGQPVEERKEEKPTESKPDENKEESKLAEEKK